MGSWATFATQSPWVSGVAGDAVPGDCAGAADGLADGPADALAEALGLGLTLGLGCGAADGLADARSLGELEGDGDVTLAAIAEVAPSARVATTTIPAERSRPEASIRWGIPPVCDDVTASGELLSELARVRDRGPR